MRRRDDDEHTHRSKRPFQPSITSFFARDDDSDSSLSDSSDAERGQGPLSRDHQQHRRAPKHQRPRDSFAPAVPASVQASLLSVGMRVRKSVPEGYKTHKTLPSLPTAALTLKPLPPPPPREPVDDHALHQRELLPFCGLHKIGGYAEQPVTNIHLYAGADAHGQRPVNAFPLPAEAFTQPFPADALPPIPNPANPSKRAWRDDDEKPRPAAEFHFKLPVTVSEDEVPVSPLSETPPQALNGFPQSALRPFAQPRTRRAGAGRDNAMIKEGDTDMDVENAEQAEGRVLVGSSSDFGEAEFLTPWEAGREVDMGGI